MSLVKRRRRPEPVPEQVAEEVAEQSVEQEPVAEPTAAPMEQLDTPEVRALRAQVKVLEQALERAVEPPDFDSYRTEVVAAVRAVALGTPESGDPRTAVARVIAALERIEAPVGRTVLPPPVGVSAPTATPTTMPAPAPAAPIQPEVAAEPETEAEAQLEAQLEQPVEQPVAPAEPEVVLPVPPPAPAPSRPRRRRRRVAA